jgi:hypothetical protein
MNGSTFPQFTAEKSLHRSSGLYSGEAHKFVASSDDRDKVLPQIFIHTPFGDYNCNQECFRVWVCAGSTNNCWWDMHCEVVCLEAPNFYP